MRKAAGIIDTLLYAPFSALTAAILAPQGTRGRATALGAVLGAGMANLAQKEYEARRARGEPVSAVDFNPLFKSLLAGLATGGGARVLQGLQQKDLGAGSAMIAGAPIGALVSGDPVAGSGIGVVAGAVLSQMAPKKKTEAEEIRDRTEAAIQRALNRIRVIQAWMRRTRPGSATRLFSKSQTTRPKTSSYLPIFSA